MQNISEQYMNIIHLWKFNKSLKLLVKYCFQSESVKNNLLWNREQRKYYLNFILRGKFEWKIGGSPNEIVDNFAKILLANHPHANLYYSIMPISIF